MALGPPHPAVPEDPEFPVLRRPLSSVCTGRVPRTYLSKTLITADGITALAGGTPLAKLDELTPRLRAST